MKYSEIFFELRAPPYHCVGDSYWQELYSEIAPIVFFSREKWISECAVFPGVSGAPRSATQLCGHSAKVNCGCWNFKTRVDFKRQEPFCFLQSLRKARFWLPRERLKKHSFFKHTALLEAAETWVSAKSLRLWALKNSNVVSPQQKYGPALKFSKELELFRLKRSFSLRPTPFRRNQPVLVERKTLLVLIKVKWANVLIAF